LNSRNLQRKQRRKENNPERFRAKSILLRIKEKSSRKRDEKLERKEREP
jgi:hypothetical protein